MDLCVLKSHWTGGVLAAVYRINVLTIQATSRAQDPSWSWGGEADVFDLQKILFTNVNSPAF